MNSIAVLRLKVVGLFAHRFPKPFFLCEFLSERAVGGNKRFHRRCPLLGAELAEEVGGSSGNAIATSAIVNVGTGMARANDPRHVEEDEALA